MNIICFSLNRAVFLKKKVGYPANMVKGENELKRFLGKYKCIRAVLDIVP